ncbi:MAG TPA: MFS transporter [Solirubrobacterales bacterium]|nr:MFS transporter [Solirubrobacterales bacterium]HNF84697.1 MFS transporter [Solirubrobacterales bacterium]HNI40880.1 MFS transporter [Solirubrobacterales bacterium]HNK35659.1 MFS transporter [Solirubrobacterales bacterium]HNK66645.1 MFS transporter [Solirubrobacterales bacterium]
MTASQEGVAPGSATKAGGAPEKPAVVLLTLILVAAVANLNLAVANVALPDIGKDLDASQTGLNLVAVGFSLGLASSVLYLGALGDRYGRKMMLIIGTTVSIPAAILAGFAPNVDVLFLARVLGGLAAGMAFPTTLALITALWSGAKKTRAIALWSGIGGGISALGPLVSGALLEHFDWGSVFLVTLPLAVIALILALRFVPSHVNETTDPVDNFGGILSIIMVGGVVLAINFVSMPGYGETTAAMALIGVAAGIGFFIQQRREGRIGNPLYDLKIAGRRTFWVAGTAGIIVFGTLMAAMFIGQQYLQNVLEYSTLGAGAAILPAALGMIVAAPRSARLVESHGSRFTLLCGFVFCLIGFIFMLTLWDEGAAYWQVLAGYLPVGIGVGLAGTPSSNSLTSSVPVKRAGMASGTADLQRDLGGALMQSILGSVLTSAYASSFASQIAGNPEASQKVSESTQTQLERSFGSAVTVAEQHPQYAPQIVHAAQTAFLNGSDSAYVVGIAAIVLGAVLVFFAFPKKEQEHALLAGFHAEDTGEPVPATATA